MDDTCREHNKDVSKVSPKTNISALRHFYQYQYISAFNLSYITQMIRKWPFRAHLRLRKFLTDTKTPNISWKSNTHSFTGWAPSCLTLHQRNPVLSRITPRGRQKSSQWGNGLVDTSEGHVFITSAQKDQCCNWRTAPFTLVAAQKRNHRSEPGSNSNSWSHEANTPKDPKIDQI